MSNGKAQLPVFLILPLLAYLAAPVASSAAITGAATPVRQGAAGSSPVAPATVQTNSPLAAAPAAALVNALPAFTVNNVTAGYGQVVMLKAVLKRGGAPLPNASVGFWIDWPDKGSFKLINTVKTGPDGLAQISYGIPPSMPKTNKVQVKGEGIAATFDLILGKGDTDLALTVPGDITEGTTITFTGQLKYKGNGAGPQNRKVKLLVDGKVAGSDDTNAVGQYQVSYSVPFIYQGGSNHAVKTVFEGDADFNASSSGGQTITVKKQPNKLPPTVTVAPPINASGYY